MSNLYYDVLRKSEAFKQNQKDIQSKPSHAYLYITKDEDIAQSFFKLIALAKFCTSHSACMNCDECKKVLEDSNANIFIVNEDNRKLFAEDIQKVLDSLYPAPLFGNLNLYFIQNFDAIDATTQNKLLKSIEDPPEHAMFFLSAQNERKVLSTIRSRCRIVNLDNFDIPTIVNFLMGNGTNRETAQIAASFCDGQIQKAYAFANDESFISRFDFVKEMLLNMNGSRDIVKYNTNLYLKSNPQKTLDILFFVFKIILDYHIDSKLLNGRLPLDIADILKNKYSKQAIILIIDHITETMTQLTYNVNEGYAIDTLLFKIMETKHKCK